MVPKTKNLVLTKIGGRVSDASPVIAAAQWWHNWSDTSYDELAGALIGGHLIECSTYSTGANFSGFFKYETAELLNLGLPIVEIAASGECVVTKAESLNGHVTRDTVCYHFPLLFETVFSERRHDSTALADLMPLDHVPTPL